MGSRIALGLIAPACLLAAILAARSTPADAAAAHLAQSAPAKETATAEEARARCSGCHAMAPPSIMPKAAWRDELVRMMLIQEGVPEPAGASGFIPLPPDWIRLLRYFEANAPDRLPAPEPWPAVDQSIRLTRRPMPATMPQVAIAIANTRFVDLDGDKRLDVVATDMRSGPVFAALAADNFALKPLASLGHPAHVEPVDLDRDGRLDLLVTDLGSFQPADHENGRLVWLQRTKAGAFQPVVLARGLGRVADARVADFDGDGDGDIIVGVFGWRKTGNVTLLENRTTRWTAPSFVPKTIDPRTGAIHVPVTDLNRDGRPDFVALFAQQHESIVAFLNTGKLAFETRTIYAAPHPNWGSSGIELVDLDKDGDLDVLYTHGDTFDDFVLKPYHGIQWLENTGTFPFVEHALATLPGAQRAQAADMDGDGDLDIVAAAMIAGGEVNERLASLVWLEQTEPGVFARHTIEMGSPNHATLDLADADGDGRPDIVVGWFAFSKPFESWLDMWTSRQKP
jgi:FG-GAP-like repeat